MYDINLVINKLLSLFVESLDIFFQINLLTCLNNWLFILAILGLWFRESFNCFYKSFVVFNSLEILVIIIEPLAFMNMEKMEFLLIFLFAFLFFFLLTIFSFFIIFLDWNLLFVNKLLYLLKRLHNLGSELTERAIF